MIADIMPIIKMVQVVRFELTIFPPQTERDNQITLHLYKWCNQIH